MKRLRAPPLAGLRLNKIFFYIFSDFTHPPFFQLRKEKNLFRRFALTGRRRRADARGQKVSLPLKPPSTFCSLRKDLQNRRAVILYSKSNSSFQTKNEKRWTMFVYIGGIPGVGKTTVVTEAEELARKYKIKMEKIKGAPILCELAGVTTVAELRALPESVRRALRPEMNRRLYELDRADFGTIRLADGHFVYFDVEGKEYGVRQIQPWDKEQTIAIAVIIANPNSILSRRLKDVSDRPDRKHDINFLIQEQKMEIDVAVSQAKELNIPFCFIRNEGNEAPTAAETLLSFCIHQALCRTIGG